MDHDGTTGPHARLCSAVRACQARLLGNAKISSLCRDLRGLAGRRLAAIGAGTALVGNSQSAQVWNRGGMQVEATNSHASNFTLNLSVIRAERRLGLCVYRSNGFTEVRLA
jgi:hypothetical protein